jgi:hypothetical protein
MSGVVNDNATRYLLDQQGVLLTNDFDTLLSRNDRDFVWSNGRSSASPEGSTRASTTAEKCGNIFLQRVLLAHEGRAVSGDGGNDRRFHRQ